MNIYDVTVYQSYNNGEAKKVRVEATDLITAVYSAGVVSGEVIKVELVDTTTFEDRTGG